MGVGEIHRGMIRSLLRVWFAPSPRNHTTPNSLALSVFVCLCLCAVCFRSLAAEQGHPAARYNLGFCYMQGLGVDKLPDQAFKYGIPSLSLPLSVPVMARYSFCPPRMWDE